MGSFGDRSTNPLYETGTLFTIKVFADRIEYKPGPLDSPDVIPLSQVASIRSKFLKGVVIVETSGGREYEMVTAFNKKKVMAAINHAMAMQRAPAQQTTAPPSLADELVKLRGLLNQGLLTPEEFEVQKKRLLR